MLCPNIFTVCVGCKENQPSSKEAEDKEKLSGAKAGYSESNTLYNDNTY